MGAWVAVLCAHREITCWPMPAPAMMSYCRLSSSSLSASHTSDDHTGLLAASHLCPARGRADRLQINDVQWRQLSGNDSVTPMLDLSSPCLVVYLAQMCNYCRMTDLGRSGRHGRSS